MKCSHLLFTVPVLGAGWDWISPEMRGCGVVSGPSEAGTNPVT